MKIDENESKFPDVSICSMDGFTNDLGRAYFKKNFLRVAYKTNRY